MCPSYMVTQDEEHSTRGRANLLRQVLNGAMSLEEISGDRLHEALDLCVECKACKAECPSGVDLAKIKYEVLAHRRREHGVPLRDRAFANIATLLRLGAIAPRLANAVGATPLARMALKQLGIHPERPIPQLARQSFEQWFRHHSAERASRSEVRGDVVLFDDTFTNYVHPEVGKAATRVIEALGFNVIRVEGRGCCGRPSISKGLLDDARALAERNVSALLPFAERGIPIVGTEPSCLLTLRDEYPLLLKSDAAASVAAQSLLIDEWLRAQLNGADVPQVFDGRHGSLMLHAHCHQKALAGYTQTVDVLRHAGYEAQVIDSGCCGMAGSFGFETEHYGISRQMGEYRLFPAVRDAGDIPVAVTGVSCRQQIGHFTDAEPRHVVEYLADALKPA